VIGHELRHQVVAVAKPAAAVTLERKAQRETKLVGIGGGQFGNVIGHAGRLDQPGEHIKNICKASCVTATGAAILTRW
jgi:3-dehydroquinate synthetase